jgi:hypothetical protein
MSNLSYFESRKGKLTCTAEELFMFVTDIRNFERFAPGGTISSWHAEKEFCSFNVSMVGNVNMRIADSMRFNRVEYKGDALSGNNFSLELKITGDTGNPAEILISLNADLNPVLKMMAAKPIGQFLELLVTEMEKFKEWNDLKE